MPNPPELPPGGQVSHDSATCDAARMRDRISLIVGLSLLLATLAAVTSCDQQSACHASCMSEYESCLDEGSLPDVCADFLDDCDRMCDPVSGPPP